MKSIKTSISAKLAALLFGAALFGLVSHSALAAGTLSGTSISNTATLSYSVATVAQTAIPATTTFVVDDKVNVLVAGGVITNVTPGQNGVLTPFTVTNSGNATQGYNLVAADAASGAYTVNATGITDNFDPAAGLTIYRDNDCNGAINGADAVVTTIPTLPPNAGVASTACLLVQTDIAGTQVNGDAAVVSLKATTVWPTPLVPAEENTITPPTAGAVVAATGGANTTDVDVVLADGAGVVDAVTNGDYSTYGAFNVQSAVLSVAKVATVLCDPINGNSNPKNIPGAAVQYAVTITNAAGAASATLTQVTDTLVAAMGFDTKLISGAGAPPATACTSAGGTSLSASGFGAVSGAGVATTYAAPGLAGQATTAGATQAAGVITIDFTTLASPTYGLVGGVLPANSFVTVYFNAFVQ